MMNSPLFPCGGKTHSKLEITETCTFRECQTGRRFEIRVLIVVLLYILHYRPKRHPSHHTHHICTHHPAPPIFKLTCLQLVMNMRLVAFARHGPAQSTSSPPSEMHLKDVFWCRGGGGDEKKMVVLYPRVHTRQIQMSFPYCCHW